MLPTLIMLAAGFAIVIAIVLFLRGTLQRRRRRLSRARRQGAYAERQTTWRNYFALKKTRDTPRLTDERETHDPS